MKTFIILMMVTGFFVTAKAGDQLKLSDIANKAQEFAKENPNCTSAVIESLKKKSTVTCAEALKPNTKDKKKALQEKCESLKAELKSAQGSCTSK
jgi:hypothetical protein